MNKSNRSNYERRILRLLSKTEETAVDVEKIRRECHIGNWQTALKHCLELLYDGRIQGAKSSKGWIFWAKSSSRGLIRPEVIGIQSMKPVRTHVLGFKPGKTLQTRGEQ